jgi:tetratricopeptide (TPR) repeat protein
MFMAHLLNVITITFTASIVNRFGMTGNIFLSPAQPFYCAAGGKYAKGKRKGWGIAFHKPNQRGERSMKKNGFRMSLPVVLFVCAMIGACASAPPAQQPAYPGFKLEIDEQAKIHNATGLEYAEKGLFLEAIEEYKKAIQIAPSYADAYTNCSRAYYAIGDSDLALYYVMKRDEIQTQKTHAIREMMGRDLPGLAPADPGR